MEPEPIAYQLNFITIRKMRFDKDLQSLVGYDDNEDY
jgi:hypothetical protein